MAMSSDGRPGVTQTHRGRRVLWLMVLALAASFLFLIISNKISGSSSASASGSPSQTVSGTYTENVLPDGSTQTIIGNAMSPAVPNAFSPGAGASSSSAGAAQSTDAAADPTATPTVMMGSAVPESDSGWLAATQVARAAVAPYCTWSDQGSAQDYYASVPGLTSEYAASFKDAVTKSWPSVQAQKSSATCHPITASNVTPVSYDTSKNIAVMDVQMVQQTQMRGQKSSRTVSYKVTVVKPQNTWQVDAITG